MGLFRRGKKQQYSTQKLPFTVKLAVVLFIGYIAYSDFSARHPDATFSNTFDGLVNTVSNTAKEVQKPLHDIQIKAGEGRTLLCGETANVHIKISDGKGKVLLNTLQDKEPLSLRTGDSKVLKGISAALAGMRMGEIKEAKLSPPAALTPEGKAFEGAEAGQPLTVTLALLSGDADIPAESKTQLGIQTFKGRGRSLNVYCNDEIMLDYALFSTKGTLIKESKGSQKLRLGDDIFPAALHTGLIKLENVAGRIVVPGNYLKGYQPAKGDGVIMLVNSITLVATPRQPIDKTPVNPPKNAASH